MAVIRSGGGYNWQAAPTRPAHMFASVHQSPCVLPRRRALVVFQATSDSTCAASSLRMELILHAVVRGPSLIGLGNRPAATPRHHADGEIGKTLRIASSRTKPSGSPGSTGSVWVFLRARGDMWGL